MKEALVESYLTPTIKRAIVDVGLESFPNETGGYLVKTIDDGLKFIPSPNTAPVELQHDLYVPDPVTRIKADLEGDIVAFVHTHPITSAKPSTADIAACNKGDIPWIICSPKLETFEVIVPTPDAAPVELLGRPFVWGVFDCLGLMRDVYKQHLGLEVPDFDRGPIFGWDTDPNWNLIEQNVLNAGFRILDHNEPPKPYDLLLMSIRAKYGKINHIATLVNNEGLFYHHLLNQLSTTGVFAYGSWWDKVTTKKARHRTRI